MLSVASYLLILIIFLTHYIILGHAEFWTAAAEQFWYLTLNTCMKKLLAVKHWNLWPLNPSASIQLRVWQRSTQLNVDLKSLPFREYESAARRWCHIINRAYLLLFRPHKIRAEWLFTYSWQFHLKYFVWGLWGKSMQFLWNKDIICSVTTSSDHFSCI